MAPRRPYRPDRPDHHTSCCALWCSNNGRNRAFKFFSFPADDRYDAWLTYVHRKDLERKSKARVRNSHRICEEHFKDEDFADPGKTRLIWSAVPSAAVPPRMLRLLPCIKATGESSCKCVSAYKPSLDRKVIEPSVNPVGGVEGPRHSSGITALSATTLQDEPQPSWDDEAEISIPELVVDFDDGLPKPSNAVFGADGIIYLDEASVPEPADEGQDKDGGCSYSDSGGSLAGSIGYDSDDDALTKTTGVQTDEGDAGMSTYSTFVCLLTQDGAATQVTHNPGRPSAPETPDSSPKSSRKVTISYLVY